MEEKEYSHVFRSLGILRNVTILVKVFPFVYTFAFLVSMICYRCCSEEVCTLLDMVFYYSPMSCFFLIVLSYLLKMCVWHRFQCILPILSLIGVIIDTFFTEVSMGVFIVDNAIVIFVPIASLFNGYRIFCCK